MLRSRSLSVLLCLVALLCVALSGCVSVPRIQVGEQLSARDLALGYSKGRNRDDGAFTEQLVIRGALEGGGSFYAKLTVSNIAGTDGRATAQFDVTLPDGRKARYRERKERGDWQTSGEQLTAQVGEARFEVGLGEAHVEVKAEHFEAQLVVQTELPALRPVGGVFDVGGQWYVTTIPIPRGEARLTIKASFNLPESDGAAPPEQLSSQGIAYAEHRAGNVPPYELARAWFNVLHIDERETLVMSAFEKATAAESSGRGGGWIFAANAEGLHLYEPKIDVWTRAPSQDEETGYLVPSLIFMADSERRTFQGVLKTNTLSDKRDDLSGLKRLERVVVRRFMQPWTFSFAEAEYLLRKQEPGQPSHDLTGSTRFLYQQLR